MRIRIRTDLALGDRRALVERRLRFALSRFEPRIASIDVRLCDINGPRGGIDHRCRLVVRLRGPHTSIIVEDEDVNLESAVSRVTDRAARGVARALDSSRDGRRLFLRRQDVA
jgi:hypothetical protein